MSPAQVPQDLISPVGGKAEACSRNTTSGILLASSEHLVFTFTVKEVQNIRDLKNTEDIDVSVLLQLDLT